MSRTTDRGCATAGRRGRSSLAVLFALLAATAVVACDDDNDLTGPDPVGTFVGPDGGTVTTADLTLVIPAGALDEQTDIVVEQLGDADYTGDPFFIDGTAYRIQPAGLALDGGATLMIRYELGNVPDGYYPERLRIQERDQDQWREMTQSRVRLQEHAVEAQINHLGTYGVVGRDPSKMNVASIEIEPATLEIGLDETGQLTATPLCEEGKPLERDVTWSSSDELIATVDDAGLVTGIAEGEATMTAAVEGVEAEAAVTVAGTVASITVTPETFEISEDETLQLVAEARDANGNILDRIFDWTSSNESVATVDEEGLVTGVAEGDVTISAAAGGKQGGSQGGVSRRVVTITLETPSEEPLGVGLTRQLTAIGYDANGMEVANAHFLWESSDDGIASVDQNGLVTGVAQGTAVISASVRTGASAAIDIRVIPGGGEEEATGNNLSWPLVFADGIGITGSPVATDPGVRPSTAEVDAYAEFSAIPVTNPAAEFFYSGNAPDVGSYYLQKTANSWRAQIVDGSGQSTYDASAYWGDNLTGSASKTVDRPIRVEAALSTTDGVSLLGYNMPYVENPSSPEEIQGTDGTTVSLIPLIYTAGPTLTIEQLDGPGGSVIATVMSGPFKAEINVGGRVIYGAQFRPTVPGTYRLRFILDGGANVRLIETNAGTLSAMETAIEIQVTD